MAITRRKISLGYNSFGKHTCVLDDYFYLNPKGILYKIIKKCLNFPWTTKRDKEDIPLVQGKRLATKKNRDGN
jgi:hypothetical protein